MTTTRTAQGLHRGLLEGRARVVAVEGHQVWLAGLAPAACGPCASRNACGAGGAAGTAAARPWPAPRTTPHDTVPLTLGETVRVGVDAAALRRAMGVAYALPPLAMVVAAIALQGAGDTAAATAAVAGGLLGILAARRWLRRWRLQLAPQLLGRAAPASSCVPARHPPGEA